MIVIGDISGNQGYVFDVPEEGGGQARRLRARSFFVQLLAEAAMLRVAKALHWTLHQSLLYSVAGKSALDGDAPPDAARRLHELRQSMKRWLITETSGELRISLAWSKRSGSDLEQQYAQASIALQQAKHRAWSALAVHPHRWNLAA